MVSFSTTSSNKICNPLDYLEDIANGQNWVYERTHSDELLICLSGDWCEYHATINWHEQNNMLQFGIGFILEFAKRKMSMKIENNLYKLLSVINNQSVLGHFEIWEEDNLVIWRFTEFLRHNNESVVDHKWIINFAIKECNRFYPAFQYVLWGNSNADHALKIVNFETCGSA